MTTSSPSHGPRQVAESSLLRLWSTSRTFFASDLRKAIPEAAVTLTPSARKLYAWLRAKGLGRQDADGWAPVTVGAEYVARQIQMHPNTVRRARRDLWAAGLLEDEGLRAPGALLPWGPVARRSFRLARVLVHLPSAREALVYASVAYQMPDLDIIEDEEPADGWAPLPSSKEPRPLNILSSAILHGADPEILTSGSSQTDRSRGDADVSVGAEASRPGRPAVNVPRRLGDVLHRKPARRDRRAAAFGPRPPAPVRGRQRCVSPAEKRRGEEARNVLSKLRDLRGDTSPEWLYRSHLALVILRLQQEWTPAELLRAARVAKTRGDRELTAWSVYGTDSIVADLVRGVRVLAGGLAEPAADDASGGKGAPPVPQTRLRAVPAPSTAPLAPSEHQAAIDAVLAKLTVLAGQGPPA